jgi:hypothetical protein
VKGLSFAAGMHGSDTGKYYRLRQDGKLATLIVR